MFNYYSINPYIMNDFDEIIASLKKGIGEMAEDAQKKYNELVEYLDSHSSDEIKADLRKHAENIGGIDVIRFTLTQDPQLVREMALFLMKTCKNTVFAAAYEFSGKPNVVAGNMAALLQAWEEVRAG